jgi:hypothetical protein
MNNKLIIPSVYLLGFGEVAVGSYDLHGTGVLTISHLSPASSLGTIIKEGDIVPNTTTSIIFLNTKEVDKMIKRLETLKKKMKSNKKKKVILK